MTNFKKTIVSYSTIVAFISMGMIAIPSLINTTDDTPDVDILESTVELESTIETNENKAKAKEYYEVWSTSDWDKLNDLLAEDYVTHTKLPGVTPDREGMKQWMMGVKSAFPDVQFTVEQQVAEGDIVVTRWSAIGTHEGAFMGAPPTGNKSKVTGISIVRYKDGLSVESWGEWDALGMMQSMGALKPNKKEGK